MNSANPGIRNSPLYGLNQQQPELKSIYVSGYIYMQLGLANGGQQQSTKVCLYDVYIMFRNLEVDVL